MEQHGGITRFGQKALTLGGKHVERTFVGFEHDEFERILQIWSVDWTTFLDHHISSEQIQHFI